MTTRRPRGFVKEIRETLVDCELFGERQVGSYQATEALGVLSCSDGFTQPDWRPLETRMSPMYPTVSGCLPKVQELARCTW